MGDLGKVVKFISCRGIKAEVMYFKSKVTSVRTASKASGFPEEKILKTLIVLGDNKPYAVILPGERKLDFEKLRDKIGVRECRLATPREVEEITGFRPGEVSPLTEEVGKLTLLIDSSALGRGEVLVGGGSNYALVKISVDELVKTLNPLVVDVSY